MRQHTRRRALREARATPDREVLERVRATPEHGSIEHYEDIVFYEILAEELALRDMDGEPLTGENYRALMERIDTYLSEFDRHGTDHVNVDLEE